MAADLFYYLDSQLDRVISGWNIYTTVLCVVLAGYLIYPLVFHTEPDTHVFLLARQSQPSRVRQVGESSAYRSHEVPHSYPLKTGLKVKDPGAPKWTAGRDGDLRDIWRRACIGAVDGDGKPKGEVGKVFTLLGKEEVVENSFEKLSAELNAIGKAIKKHGSSRVAIYLSNTPELLITLFACLFYGLTPILISQEQPLDSLATTLKKTNADILVVGAGSVPLKELVKKYTGLKEVIWVVPRSSRHLDWNEVPEGEGGKADVGVWHDIVDEEGSFASSELPANDTAPAVSNVIVVANQTGESKDHEIIEYTQENLVAAIGSQVTSLPFAHRISSSDLLLPLVPLTSSYALTITLAALFSGASLALTSVTGRSASYESAFNFAPKVVPTIIISDPLPLYQYEAKRRGELTRSGITLWSTFRHNRLLSHLTTTGAMPASSSLPVPKGQESLRLICTQNLMIPFALNNLRVFTGARVVVGLTHPRVAGTITQTHMLDYRATKAEETHYGAPLSCVEIKLLETPGYSIEDDETLREGKSEGGKLAVRGPSVVGGGFFVLEARVFRITEQGTLGVIEDDAEARTRRAVREAISEDLKK